VVSSGPNFFRSSPRPKKNNGKIFASLYELNDPELISAIVDLGKDCSLILANGAFKSNNPPNNDENIKARTQLKGKINLFDRIVKTGHFAHNKFVVFCDANEMPQRVLTGSTNWTVTGLCTQANNGLIIDDPNVAANFLDAWNRIKAAGNDYTPETRRFLHSENARVLNFGGRVYIVDICLLSAVYLRYSVPNEKPPL